MFTHHTNGIFVEILNYMNTFVN